MRKLFNDEAGFIVSAELMLVATIVVLGMVVGLASVRDSIVAELCDVSSAFGAIDQSFNYAGIHKPKNDGTNHRDHGTVPGSGFNDKQDNCDCQVAVTSEVCGKSQPGTLGESATAP